MSTRSFQARRVVADQREAGSLINAAGRKKTESVVILDNGTVIASPLTVQRILTAVEKSNSKSTRSQIPSQTVRLKVYDACDEDPDESGDDEATEISSDIGD